MATLRAQVEQALPDDLLQEFVDEYISVAHARETIVLHIGPLLDAAEQERDALRQALKPFAEFAAKFNAKPIRGLHDNLYGIHSGEDGAEFRLSDCRKALELLSGGAR